MHGLDTVDPPQAFHGGRPMGAGNRKRPGFLVGPFEWVAQAGKDIANVFRNAR
jgi:hypothetical protein